ncbi:MKRN2 opposite strand protein isoform X4 [Halyomorpha halys]|uniref:MKRN2 opposite strand protein isoform X4 n=1 Tax=Halyomorpha halys TaxID=286706 RepID=UPI0034D3097A
MGFTERRTSGPLLAVPSRASSFIMARRDPGILCFEHCGQRRIFCFELPEHCPACRAALLEDTSIIPFSEYKLSMDLHIGITTTQGQTVEYDKDGLSYGRDWSECLLVYQLQIQDEEAIEIWDSVIDQVSSLDSWSPLRYNEETFNCYTFVLAFLRCLKYPPLTEAVKSKTIFCEHFVLPRTEIAWKYIKLYRRLKDSGYYVSKINKSDITECGL